MDSIVTLEQLLSLEDTLNSIVKEYDIRNDYIDEEICNQYDILEIKGSLSKILKRFKSARYLYDFSIDERISITPNYETKINQFQQTKDNINFIKVDNNIDARIETTNIYYALTMLCKNVTGDEFNYFMGTFFQRKSEDEIAYLIGISKTYLQKIKKSALVKAWTFLQKFDDDN